MLINTRDMSSNGPVEALKEMSFSISRDERDEEFAMEVMSAQLYSDKLKIVCQEYLTNARDAHREAGKSELPVKVHLPTTGEPWYEVSDMGSGISPENFDTVFLKYFASTKRDDNSVSKKQNGGFGLGAKSAWSYTPEFFVNTVHDGVEYCYHCFRNSEKKRKAALTSQSRIGSGEHNGTKIRINISVADIPEFVGKFRDITFMWGVKPNVINIPNFYPSLDDRAVIFESNDVMVFKKNCGARNSVTALVDGIPYPIDTAVVKNLLNDGEKKFVSEVAAYIYCDKLEVDPTPNRENLEYNARTLNYIVKKIQLAHSSVFDMVQKKINTASNYWEACCIWYNDEDISGICRNIQTPTYNGILLPSSTSNSITYENTYGRGKRRTSVYVVTFNDYVNKGTINVSVNESSKHNFNVRFPIVFQIGGSPHKCNDKLIALYKELSKNSNSTGSIGGFNLVRMPSDEGVYNNVIDCLEKTYNWSNLHKYNLSEVEIPKPPRSPRNSTSVVGRFYIIDKNNLTKVDVDFKNRNDVYVTIKNKTVTIMGKNYRYDSPEVALWKNISAIDFTQIKLYAIPERFVKKIKNIKTMRSLDEAISYNIEKLKVMYNFDDVVIKSKNLDKYRTIRQNLGYNFTDFYEGVKESVSQKSFLARVWNFYKSSTSTSVVENNILWYIKETGYVVADQSENSDPKLLEMQNLMEIFHKHYSPLMSIISIYSCKSDDAKKLLRDIVKMIEGKISTMV